MPMGSVAFRCSAAAAALLVILAASPAAAFAFHCTGNACRVVGFLDEGLGCTVVTNHGRAPVHISQGIDQLSYDLQPEETEAPLNQAQCYGYYSGGETASDVMPAR